MDSNQPNNRAFTDKTILVIGNVCVDLIARVPESFLDSWGIAPAICTALPDRAAERALSDAANYRIFPGGSGGNIATAMAHLGLNVTFIGAFGTDAHSAAFRASLTEAGVRCIGIPQDTLLAQLVFTFITPNHERSFACFYDQDTFLDPDALELAYSKASYILTDGYSLLFPRIATQLDHFDSRPKMIQKYIFCPNDPSVIETVPYSVQSHFRFSDIMLMNEAESVAMSRLLNTSNILKYMTELNKSGAVTRGSAGAELFMPHHRHVCPTLTPDDTIVNMNGAGDAFTAGYMYGLVHDFSLEATGQIASLCARAVLQSESPRLGRDAARRIIEEMRQFL